MIQFFFLLFLFIYPSLGVAQVNIEQYRYNNDGQLNNKYSEVVDIKVNVSKSVATVYRVGMSYFKPLDLHPSLRSFLISKFNYSKKNSQEFLNHSFFHFRTISNQKKGIKPEVFIQYEKNNTSSSVLRYLGGGGVRYKLSSQLILGTGVLHEWYKEAGDENRTKTWRLSQYVTILFPVNSNNTINLSMYIQPKLLNISNIRYYAETSLKSNLTDTLSFYSGLVMKYFSKSRVYSDMELFFDSGIQLTL